MPRRRAEVTALADEEAALFLERVGLWNEYDDGRLLCAICREPLRRSGLGAARLSKNGQIVFACGKLECQEEFHRVA